MMIDLNLVRREHGLKNTMIFMSNKWDKNTFFKSDYISQYLHNWVELRMGIVFIIGEKPYVWSKYSHSYDLLLIWGTEKK